jgi:hypothetical protein
VAGFVTQAARTNEAAAERSSALEQNIAKLPAFLRELTPTMQALGGFADQATPVFTDLGKEAPSINRVIEDLGPFSEAGIPAFKSLGDAAVVGGPALTKSKPIITDVGQLASNAKPLTNNLASLLTSLKNTGGIERLMDYLFYQVAAINGFDAYGHYLRAGLILNQCSQYSITASGACTANFSSDSGSARAAAAGADDPRRSPDLRKLDAYFRGKTLHLPTKTTPHRAARKATAQRTAPAAATPAPAAATPTPAAATPAPAPAGQPDGSDPSQSLLDYLLGSDG